MTSASNERLTIFAHTNFHGTSRLFGIRQADRRAHMYVIGKTGTGKSTLLETMMRQDIQAGDGFALLDPHGDLIERVLAAIPEARKRDLIYFNVPDTTQPLGFNPLERVPPAQRALAASYLLEAFKKLWAQFWGPRSEHILRNALFALLEQPQATLADVLRLFDDATFRKTVADRVANAQVRRFWLKEYESYPARLRADSIAPIQNKIGAFLADTRLKDILTQTKSAFDLRKVMDEGQILLVNLAKGKIGEDTASLLGALLVTRFAVSALSRADTPEEKRRPFYLYLDEFHTFTTLSIASMLSELRKYRVGMILAHQYISQLDEKVCDAILGNVGTMISFRLGAQDAKVFKKEFSPEFSALDLVSLPNYEICLKLMVEGNISRPFSAETLSDFNETAARYSSKLQLPQGGG
jgi:type IV secretory pathway TraG/TraD family ATPase VirD4